MGLPLMCSLLGTWPTIQACALTGNRTVKRLVHRPTLNSLSHTSQGSWKTLKEGLMGCTVSPAAAASPKTITESSHSSIPLSRFSCLSASLVRLVMTLTAIAEVLGTLCYHVFSRRWLLFLPIFSYSHRDAHSLVTTRLPHDQDQLSRPVYYFILLFTDLLA